MFVKRSKQLFIYSLFCAFLLIACEPGSKKDAAFLEETVEELVLSNGMRFLLVPHGETPVFTAYVRFYVGGADEPVGQTGLAHLIEHMAFKGTRQWGTKDWEKERTILEEIEGVGQKLAAEYGKGAQAKLLAISKYQKELKKLYQKHDTILVREELSKEYQRRGGIDLNATTSQDLTSYFVSLPSSELKFWAETESERLFRPVFREFYRERDVVLEERRMRIIDNPVGALYRAFMAQALPESPYGRPTIGEEADLLQVTRTKAESFFQKFYRPDQAVGVLVGKFSVRKAKKILEQTFGQIPAVTAADSADSQQIPSPPYQRPYCRVDVTRAAQPRLVVAYHRPPLPAEEDYHFDLLATYLGEGRIGALYQNLVIEKSLAASVDVYPGVPGSRYPNMFMLYLVPRPNVPLIRLLEEVERELDTLQAKPIDPLGLARVKKQIVSDLVWGLERNSSIASELSYHETIQKNWRYLLNYPDKVNQVTAEQLQQTSKRYFQKENRCLGFLHHEG